MEYARQAFSQYEQQYEIPRGQHVERKLVGGEVICVACGEAKPQSGWKRECSNWREVKRCAR
jgi:hypothetical protein